MTLTLEGDLHILKTYLHTESEVATLRHSRLLTVNEIRMANEKKRKQLKVKGQGQMSPTSNSFQR